jgi:PGF-CTERM protein
MALAVALAAVATVTASSAAVAAPATQAETTTLDYEGEYLTLVSGPDATVSGETSLDPGTNVTVRVRSTGSSPFLVSEVATVSEDGTFSATMNLTQVADGTNATVSVRHADERLAEADAVVAADPTPTPSPTPSDPTATQTDDQGTTPGGGDSSAFGPGFGVAAALLALVAGGLLATRRD